MRRRTVFAGIAAGAAALAAGVYRFTDVFVKHYPPTPYDDLLNQIADREPARTLGAAVLKDMPDFNAAAVAALLRRGPGLGAGAAFDAKQNRVREVDGWVLPQSVALYAALAAKA